MHIQCANVLCNKALKGRVELTGKAHSRTGLCPFCFQCVKKTALPMGGYMPSTAVNTVARKVLKRLNPTASEVNPAVRYARGTRHPRGNWDERPAYRIAPLKYGRAKVRLPHILIGRRTAPSASTLAAAFVQYVLAGGIIGTGEIYNRFLAGGTFMGRRGLCVPKGRKNEVLTGDVAYSKWTLNYNDLSILGSHSLRSAKVLGLDKADRDLRAFIVVAYMRGLEAGEYNAPIAVPLYSMAGGFLGDHPHDHQFAPRADVPRRYLKSIRRSSGLINGKWPDGLDIPADERTANRLNQIAFNASKAPTYTPQPSATDWIFNHA